MFNVALLVTGRDVAYRAPIWDDAVAYVRVAWGDLADALTPGVPLRVGAFTRVEVVPA